MRKNRFIYCMLVVVMFLAVLFLTSCQQSLLLKEVQCECEPFLTALNCVDYEDLQVGSIYYVSEDFDSNGVRMFVNGFTLSNNTYIDNGFAEVENNGFSGGLGNDIHLKDVNLEFDWGQPIPELSLRFGEYGGELNIMINGDTRIFQNFMDIDGQIIGGVRVVSLGGYGNDMGILALEGGIEAFAIGGQSLWIDDVCPAIRRECIQFENQPLAAVFYNGVSFFDSGSYMTIMPFVWGNGVVTTNGFVTVTNNQMAGGSGQDVNINNAGLKIKTAALWRGMEIKFGEYGGNLNIEINGDFRNFDDFQDIDGSIIGNTSITVLNPYGNEMGILIIDGEIHQFVIGGQELWIDDVCPIL